MGPSRSAVGRRFAAFRAVPSRLQRGAIGRLGAGGLVLISPALLSAASGSVVVLGGSIGLLAASTAFLFRPGGWVGTVLAIVAWAGALALGASGVRVMMMSGRVKALEAALKTANAELVKAQADKDRALLRDLKREAVPSRAAEAAPGDAERGPAHLRRRAV